MQAASVEDSIQALLSQLPGFRSAAVIVTFPPHPLISRATAPAPRVSVALSLDPAVIIERARVVSMIAGLDARLAPDQIHVSLIPSPQITPHSPFSTLVGPFRVAPESAFPLQATLLICLMCISLVSGLLMIVMIRSRKRSYS